MRSSSIFKEYVWLVSLIRDAGRISFSEISGRWERASINESGLPMSRSTFNRHRTAIEEIFDIEILCDASDGFRYYINEDSPLENTSISAWMCDSLAMGTTMSDFKSLNRRISLEPIPTAGRYLRPILEAMTLNRTIEMEYHKIVEDPKLYQLEPYAVKLFKQRWYLLAKPVGGERLLLFSLERISRLSIQNQEFSIPEDFDANEYFKDIFGVMSAPDVEPQRVLLRVYGRDQFYLEDLPLHHSQQIVERTETYTDFELHLRPTSDLAAAILSRGGWVQVLEPGWFAEELLDRAGFMLESFESAFEDE